MQCSLVLPRPGVDVQCLKPALAPRPPPPPPAAPLPASLVWSCGEAGSWACAAITCSSTHVPALALAASAPCILLCCWARAHQSFVTLLFEMHNCVCLARGTRGEWLEDGSLSLSTATEHGQDSAIGIQGT